MCCKYTLTRTLSPLEGLPPHRYVTVCMSLLQRCLHPYYETLNRFMLIKKFKINIKILPCINGNKFQSKLRINYFIMFILINFFLLTCCFMNDFIVIKMFQRSRERMEQQFLLEQHLHSAVQSPFIS